MRGQSSTRQVPPASPLAAIVQECFDSDHPGGSFSFTTPSPKSLTDVAQYYSVEHAGVWKGKAKRVRIEYAGVMDSSKIACGSLTSLFEYE